MYSTILVQPLSPQSMEGFSSSALGRLSTEQPSRQNTLVANQHSGTHSVLLVCRLGFAACALVCSYLSPL